MWPASLSNANDPVTKRPDELGDEEAADDQQRPTQPPAVLRGGRAGRLLAVTVAVAERDDSSWAGSPPPFAIVEIAYDEETAHRMWDDNVPQGLRERTGDPERPGLYGHLDGVDFDTEVVVVWSSGESSSCPGWLAAIQTDAAGTVRVERDDTSGMFGACTEDYNPYRMIVAVNRERIPATDTLPSADVTGVPDAPGAGGLVTAYPADT